MAVLLPEKVLSVTDITLLIKEVLEKSVSRVTVEGEISNYRPSSTGHVYFALKDSASLLSAVMFRGRAAYLPFKPADGMLVRATGTLSVYAQRGTYQLVVDSMASSGEGAILQMLEDRKRRLAAEGLFDSERKRPLPPYPAAVAVVTSPTGAALRDILQIARRRNNTVDLIVLPCPVQGGDAASSIARMIRIANEWRLADVLILGRGGGSLEDLLPFSDEALVRAVAASVIPVVSAVGHEIDWALSDFAADVRAPTPSAAAELVVWEKAALLSYIASTRGSLENTVQGKLEQTRLLLRAFTSEAMERQFRSIEQPLLMRFQDALDALGIAMLDVVDKRRRRIENAVRDLNGANPQTLLNRGYSMVRSIRSGQVVRSYRDVSVGDPIEIVPASGKITAEITRCEADSKV